MTDEAANALRTALRAWDTYEPDMTTARMVSQANAMAEAIRVALNEHVRPLPPTAGFNI